MTKREKKAAARELRRWRRDFERAMERDLCEWTYAVGQVAFCRFMQRQDPDWGNLPETQAFLDEWFGRREAVAARIEARMGKGFLRAIARRQTDTPFGAEIFLDMFEPEGGVQ
jgi:hypothetical protein